MPLRFRGGGMGGFESVLFNMLSAEAESGAKNEGEDEEESAAHSRITRPNAGVGDSGGVL